MTTLWLIPHPDERFADEVAYPVGHFDSGSWSVASETLAQVVPYLLQIEPPSARSDCAGRSVSHAVPDLFAGTVGLCQLAYQ